MSYQLIKYKKHDWLGEVPKEWQLKKFKHLFTGSNEKYKDYPVGEMLSVSGYRGIEIKKYDHESQKRSEKDLEEYRVVRPGQLVVNTMWLNYSGLGISEFEGYVSPAYRSYFVNEAFHPRYVHHLMRSEIYVRGYTKFMQGVRPNSLQIKTDDFNVFPILVPSMEEQKQIAAVLDRETAAIDTLIAKQERLIALLQEKRQAVISHAVTKGLNPAAEMKASGLSWAPEVPAHWSLTQNRSLIQIRRVLVGQRYSEYQLLSLTKRGVIVRDLSSGEGKHSDYLERTQEVRPGDFVFCLFDVEETPRTVGLSNHLGMISGDYTIFECSEKLAARFIEYFYKAMDDRKLLRPLYRGLRKRIPKPQFLRIRTPMPPSEELSYIVEYLDNFEIKLKQLTKTTLKQIELLKERRTALISAAVTGKIDLRNG